jgi:methionine sulfoxide reductase heme-binding subunit
MITWNVLRAAGFGAYLVLFLSVVLGLLGATSLGRDRESKQSSIGAHQFLASVGLLLLAIHLAGVVLDPWIHFRTTDLFLPMLQDAYRPVAVALGIVAMYAMVLVTVASWVRRHLSVRFWRGTHMLAIPMFAMAMLHGVLAGTDSVRPVVFSTYVATGGIVVFLTLVRAFTVRSKRTAVLRPETVAVRVSD